MILYGNRVRLTGIEARDQAALNELMNDPTAEAWVESAFWPVSMHQQEKWFQAKGDDASCRRLAIRSLQDDEIIGFVSAYEMDFKNSKVGTGVKLRGGVQRQGLRL